MIVRELGNAWQRLVRHPGYTALSVSVLGVGLGVVVFLFGLIDTMILRPLPFPHANRLMVVGYASQGGANVQRISAGEFLDLKQALHGFDAIGAYGRRTIDVDAGAGAVSHEGASLSASVLSMLGVKPLLGRGFLPADNRPGAPRVVLINEHLWRQSFNADPGIVGRAIRVDGQWTTVIGVLPGNFAFPYISDVWLPTRLRPGSTARVQPMIRLSPSVSLAQARSKLQAAATALGAQLRGQRAGRRLVMQPIALRFVSETLRGYVWLMFAAGVLVLLLACVNVANLQLVRTLYRRRELAVRSALGANRGHLLREQLAESLLLSSAASALALLAAHLGERWFADMLMANASAPPYYMHFGVDARMLVFAALAAMLTTLLAGLLPAWRAARTDAQDVLRDGDRGASAGGFAHAAKAMVVVEIALTVILLASAGTFIHGLQRLQATYPGTGVDASHVLTAHVRMLPALYPDADARWHYFDQLATRLRAEPGVLDASVGNTIPGAQPGGHPFIAAYGAAQPPQGYQRAQMGIVDAHFARTYGIRLLRGRFIDAGDRADSLPVVVVDQTLARKLWPGGDALGQKLVLSPRNAHPDVYSVIGVVAPLQLDGSLAPSLPSLMLSWRQAPQPFAVVAVSTRSPAIDFAARLQQVARGVDPLTPLYAVRTQARAITLSWLLLTVLTKVFSAVGLIALLLAAAGLYGVLAFAVVQRTREIGIRRAIGAGGDAIVRQVGRQLGVQLGLGLMAGLALAWPWSRLLANPGMHTHGGDLVVFATVVAVVVFVAVIATLIPLRRALRVDPAVALRYE